MRSVVMEKISLQPAGQTVAGTDAGSARGGTVHEGDRRERRPFSTATTLR
jgi:hypothetical protein